jgi:hypothetical protein
MHESAPFASWLQIGIDVFRCILDFEGMDQDLTIQGICIRKVVLQKVYQSSARA